MTTSNNHDHHDLDLIAAHASDESDPRAAALISTCMYCHAEYDLQRQVREWLNQAPVVTMADHERSALQHRVSEQLGRLQVAGLSGKRRTRTPSALLLRLGAAAAGLAVVAGLSGVLGQLGRGGGASLTTAVGNLSASESMLPADDDDLNDAAGTMEGAATTAAFATAAPESRALPGGDEAAVRIEAEALTEEADTEPTAIAADGRVAVPPCAEEIEGLTPLLWAESILDGEPVVIIVIEGEENPEALVYRIDGCELVDL